MRADFVNAENSTGFHNPREASRMLLQAVDMARMGQTKLVEIAAANGIKDFKTSNLGFEDIQKFNPGELYYKVDVNVIKLESVTMQMKKMLMVIFQKNF